MTDSADLMVKDGHFWVRTQERLIGLLERTRGVRSLSTFRNWRGLGCPCDPDGEGFYNFTAILEWERNFFSDRDTPNPTSPTPGDSETCQALLDRIAGCLEAGDWRGAMMFVVRDFHPETATFEDIAFTIRRARKDRFDVDDLWADPVGGAWALRFAKTSRYVFVGLSREFAEAAAVLVNSRAAWLIGPEFCEADEDVWRVDLPTDGRGDSWDRRIISTNDEQRVQNGLMEAVHKPGLKLVNSEWPNLRAEVLFDMGAFDFLGIESPAQKSEWIDSLGARVQELKKQHKPRRKKTKP